MAHTAYWPTAYNLKHQWAGYDHPTPHFAAIPCDYKKKQRAHTLCFYYYFNYV